MSGKLLKQAFVVILLLFLCFTQSAQAQGFTITTTGNAIVVTDIAGNGDAINVSQSGASIRFQVTSGTPTYSLDGGAFMNFFNTPADIPLLGITQITLNMGAGDDNITVSTFSASFPNLTINGVTGDDAVNFNGNIHFAANANLDVDMQNDDGIPGVDNVSFVTSAQLIYLAQVLPLLGYVKM